MTTAAALPHPLLRVLHGLLALGLALAATWLVGTPSPAGAQAVTNWGVESPGPGQVVAGAFTLTGFVEALQDHRVDAVRSRLRRGDQPVGPVRNLQRTGDAPVGPGMRRSTWTTSVDTASLANGTYVVEVSVVSALHPEGSPWQGHQIIIDAPPVAQLETARVTDGDARTVEVRWVRSSAPDLIRYVVQRASGGGEFADVHTATSADATTHVDTTPEHGAYRYRVKVVRSGADGGEREAVSEPHSVDVKPGASGRPEGDGEPSGPLGSRDQDPDGDAAAPGPRRSGTSAPRLSTGSRPGGRARSPNVAAPGNPNSTFEEHLDYGVSPPPVWDSEDLAQGDEGTLTVFDREMSAQNALVPVAGGLVLTLFGLHIVRFLRENPDQAG